MTDRELLEAAASAAGIVIQRSRLDDPMAADMLIYLANEDRRHSAYIGWNPLTDDGDALRLACKLELQIFIVGEGMCEVKCPDRHLAPVWEHVSGSDTALATRRAIVRAAASLAQTDSMKGEDQSLP